MSMPSAVKHINEVRLLSTLYRLGRSTRADLGRELNLMRSTVGNLIGGLIENGQVLESVEVVPNAEGKSGRPGQRIRLNAKHSAYIGADIGVDCLTVTCVDLAGNVIGTLSEPYEGIGSDVAATIEKLAILVNKSIESLPKGQVVQGMCLVVPGLYNKVSGRLMRAPTLGWFDIPIVQMLRKKIRWKGDIDLENDANAFAAAEIYQRSTTPTENALYVFMDYGIGGGLVVDGHLLRGSNGYAGEIGHLHLGEQGFETQTPVQGSFESYVGRNALLALFKRHGGSAKSLEEFLHAVEESKPAALRSCTDWAWWMGRGLGSLVSIFNPAKLVLGGPMATLVPHMRVEIMDSVQRHLATPYPIPTIELTQFEKEVCALGGAMLSHRKVFSFKEDLVFGESGHAE